MLVLEERRQLALPSQNHREERPRGVSRLRIALARSAQTFSLSAHSTIKDPSSLTLFTEGSCLRIRISSTKDPSLRIIFGTKAIWHLSTTNRDPVQRYLPTRSSHLREMMERNSGPRLQPFIDISM